MKTDQYHERIADELIKAMVAGTAPWMKPWAPGETPNPRNAITGHSYRGINPLMLMAQGYGDPRWIGFGQAKKKGAAVRKGEKGTPILRVIGGGPLTDKDGAPVLDDDGNERQGRPRVKVLWVWHVSQVDGLELPSIGPAKRHDWEACERAELALKSSGVPIQHVNGDRACYTPAVDRITLPEREQFTDALGYYHTALHELGHATGHGSRLGRPGIVDGGGQHFGSQRYAREELIAEITAVMTGGQLGTGSTPQHGAAYVEGWIKVLKEDTAEIVRAAAAAQRAADWIVSRVPEEVAVAA